MPFDHLRAPAKLTTRLRVLGRRDDGMHLIDAEMVTLDLYDELVVDSDGTGVVVTDRGDGARGFVLDPDDNLITRALRIAKTDARVELTKNIPVAAGLGGGSADAAAILRWAGFTDVVKAASIGADVAFCLLGGRAHVEGIGEIVHPLPFQPRIFTVVTPPIHCSTAEVYAAWTELGGPSGDGHNDLEAAALEVAPTLAETRDALAEETGQRPQLAGSGSSWFVEGDFPHAGVVLRTLPPDLELADSADGC